MRYTIKDFKSDFPDDAACLAFIFKKRYPDGLECPQCKKRDFYPIYRRRAYACSCGYQTYPTERTIFHKSPTSLVSWFHAIFLMGQSKNGVSAMEVMRQIGVTYKCAWRICKQIRKLMTSDGGPLGGIVEMDETYMGGRKKKGLRGRGAVGKTPVFGMVERNGRVRAKMVPNIKRDVIFNEIKANVEPGTTLNTDELPLYKTVSELGYGHETIAHGKGEYARGNVHTNTIEGFWSQLKRSINGTYHSVSQKHLPSYLDEFSFRYDHRQDLTPVPVTLFSKVGKQA